ncbi:MAG: F0F1 ATP synthase subunit delta [Candidatus Paceibacterota bacterium]
MNLQSTTENITTKQDLIYLLDDINQAREVVFEGEQASLEKKTKNLVGEELRNILQKQSSLSTRQQQVDFLDELKDYLQQTPQIKLTVAFSPSDDFLEEISEWLEKEIGEKVIIDLITNHEIVGGAIIEYQGRYLNLSLAKKIDQLAGPNE